MQFNYESIVSESYIQFYVQKKSNFFSFSRFWINIRGYIIWKTFFSYIYSTQVFLSVKRFCISLKIFFLLFFCVLSPFNEICWREAAHNIRLFILYLKEKINNFYVERKKVGFMTLNALGILFNALKIFKELFFEADNVIRVWNVDFDLEWYLKWKSF